MAPTEPKREGGSGEATDQGMKHGWRAKLMAKDPTDPAGGQDGRREVIQPQSGLRRAAGSSRQARSPRGAKMGEGGGQQTVHMPGRSRGPGPMKEPAIT